VRREGSVIPSGFEIDHELSQQGMGREALVNVPHCRDRTCDANHHRTYDSGDDGCFGVNVGGCW
jgi:hypothetical protein